VPNLLGLFWGEVKSACQLADFFPQVIISLQRLSMPFPEAEIKRML
jgi:hypothetical protein